MQVLLPASSLLQMQSVREACCKFLIRQLHPSNCLGIRAFAHAHDCTELQHRAHRFALHHFQDVVATEEFMLLPVSDVSRLARFYEKAWLLEFRKGKLETWLILRCSVLFG